MDTNAQHPESREALLQELALRLITHPLDPRPQTPQLYVGHLPEHLPFELPIPEGSRIIGCLARSAQHLDALLDVPLPPEQALAFYKERLQAAGWAEGEQLYYPPGRGGFVHSRGPARSQDALFCKGPRGPSLRFSAGGVQGGFTDVRLDLNLDERESPCGQAARMRRQQRQHMGGYEQILPELSPPQGARQFGGGGGYGDDSAHSSATLEAESDPAALAAHYAGQLAQAGWTQTEAGGDGPLSWHSWTFQDEDGETWRGLFFIIKTPGSENEYFMSIKADLAAKRQRRGGFSSAWLKG